MTQLQRKPYLVLHTSVYDRCTFSDNNHTPESRGRSSRTFSTLPVDEPSQAVLVTVGQSRYNTDEYSHYPIARLDPAGTRHARPTSGPMMRRMPWPKPMLIQRN